MWAWFFSYNEPDEPVIIEHHIIVIEPIAEHVIDISKS